MAKKSPARFLQKIKTTFLEHAYFPLLKLKMWFFVQEFAAELPFLSSVKIIFKKFWFFSKILSPIRLGAILCAHAILCAPTVHSQCEVLELPGQELTTIGFYEIDEKIERGSPVNLPFVTA